MSEAGQREQYPAHYIVAHLVVWVRDLLEHVKHNTILFYLDRWINHTVKPMNTCSGGENKGRINENPTANCITELILDFNEPRVGRNHWRTFSFHFQGFMWGSCSTSGSLTIAVEEWAGKEGLRSDRTILWRRQREPMTTL